jgi:hypothetical protein
MRAYARVALVSMGVPASLGLAGCAAIEELRDAFLRWVESEKPPSGPGMIAEPEATPVIPPEQPPQKEASKPSKKPVKSARKPPKPRIVELPPTKPPLPDSVEAAKPEGTEGQSAPPQPPPLRLRTPYPEAPPPGRFSYGPAVRLFNCQPATSCR